MDTNDDIMRIIAATLKGYANQQEVGLLQSWLHEDAANREKYEMMEKIWQESGFVLSAPAFDVRKGWARLNDSITAREARGKSTFHTRSRPVFIRRQLALAACLLAAVLTGWYIWNTQLTHLQTITAEAANQTLTLPDNSKVLLRKGSSLQYPASFNNKERAVTLTGEAWFEVSHQDDQPFIVSTGHSGIKVLGTTFLVNSMPSEDEIVVVTGKVNVSDKEKEANQLTLTSGQQAVLRNNQFMQAPVTDSNFIAWKTGILNFKDASLIKVLDDIAHYYSVTIDLATKDRHDAAGVRVNARFENQSLDQVLDELRLTTGWNIKKDAGSIIFYKG